jgi:hypothetical protein
MKSPSRRLLLWIGVSLILHVALLALLRRDTPLPRTTRPPIVVTLAAPEPPPPAPTQASGTHANVKTVAKPTSTAAAAVAAATPSDNATASTPAAPTAPRTLVLLSAGALMHLGPSADLGGRTAKSDPNIKDPAAELARVQQRLNADNEAFQVSLDTQTGARGSLVELKHALIDRFTPPAALVQKIPGSAAARDQKSRNMMEAHLRPQSNAEMVRGMSPAAQAMGPGDVNDGCAGSHEIGRLEARFHIEHDETGHATACTLVRSSGHDAFDAYARTELLEAMNRPAHIEPGDAVPKFSEWLLSQVVYDWNSTASIGCPRMGRPPGRPVDPDARDPWGITYTSEITLAAVRYRH